MNASVKPFSVVVAGGGVAALEATLALRDLAQERVEITLLSSGQEFVYRPLSVLEPFGKGGDVRLDLHDLAADSGAELLIDSLVRVEPERDRLLTEGGISVPYDALLVAVGARDRPAVTGALLFWDRVGSTAVRTVLEELEAGSVTDLVFAVPTGIVWPLPLYELALMTADRLEQRGVRGVRLALATPEESPLACFGEEASHAVLRLLAERRVEVHLEAAPVAFEDGALWLADGASLAADRVIALPALEGPRVEGLPQDDEGFIPTDPYGRVEGHENVFAAGDGTASLVKQGGLAAQQADAVAETIAELAGVPVDPRPFAPVLRGSLLTGTGTLYLRAEPDGAEQMHSLASSEPVWWPAAKIFGQYLSPYLAAHALQRSPS